jgi:hypothetical protein
MRRQNIHIISAYSQYRQEYTRVSAFVASVCASTVSLLRCQERTITSCVTWRCADHLPKRKTTRHVVTFLAFTLFIYYLSLSRRSSRLPPNIHHSRSGLPWGCSSLDSSNLSATHFSRPRGKGDKLLIESYLTGEILKRAEPLIFMLFCKGKRNSVPFLQMKIKCTQDA